MTDFPTDARRVAALSRDLRDEELAGRLVAARTTWVAPVPEDVAAHHLAAMLAERAPVPGDVAPPATARPRRAVGAALAATWRTATATALPRVAGVTAAAVFAATGALATTGSLPAAAQLRLAEVAAQIGLDLPRPGLNTSGGTRPTESRPSDATPTEAVGFGEHRATRDRTPSDARDGTRLPDSDTTEPETAESGTAEHPTPDPETPEQVASERSPSAPTTPPGHADDEASTPPSPAEPAEPARPEGPTSPASPTTPAVPAVRPNEPADPAAQPTTPDASDLVDRPDPAVTIPRNDVGDREATESGLTPGPASPPGKPTARQHGTLEGSQDAGPDVLDPSPGPSSERARPSAPTVPRAGPAS